MFNASELKVGQNVRYVLWTGVVTAVEHNGARILWTDGKVEFVRATDGSQFEVLASCAACSGYNTDHVCGSAARKYETAINTGDAEDGIAELRAALGSMKFSAPEAMIVHQRRAAAALTAIAAALNLRKAS